jgi:hypothetical protein
LQIDDSLIAHLKIPNGIPLVYTMDENLAPILDFTDDLGFQANYLVSARNHGKVHSILLLTLSIFLQCILSTFLQALFLFSFGIYIFPVSHFLISFLFKQMMAYERCVRKKLRSLFEYLDTDNDGRITPSCLQIGLIRLQTYTQTPSTEVPQICEYEIEELLRCVPR